MMIQKTTPRTEVETLAGRFVLHENGVLYLYVNDNASIDETEAKQMLEGAQMADPSGQIRLLIVIGENNDLSFGAQRVFASAKGFARVVIITRTRLQAEVGQFLINMMRVLQSSYEFRLFNDIAQAEAWLLRPL